MAAKGLINSQELFLSRVLFTLVILFILRFGIVVPIPEIDQEYLYVALKKNARIRQCLACRIPACRSLVGNLVGALSDGLSGKSVGNWF